MGLLSSHRSYASRKVAFVLLLYAPCFQILTFPLNSKGSDTGISPIPEANFGTPGISFRINHILREFRLRPKAAEMDLQRRVCAGVFCHEHHVVEVDILVQNLEDSAKVDECGWATNKQNP